MEGENRRAFIPPENSVPRVRRKEAAPNKTPQETEKHSELWRAFERVKEDNEKLALLQSARNDNSINSLTPDEQRKVIRWAVARYADLLAKGKGDDFIGAIGTVGLFMPNIRDHKKTDIIDTVMEMVPELYLEHPEALDQITNVLDQDAQVVRPDIYLDTVGKILSQPGMPPEARQRALAGLSYQASFGLLPYLEDHLRHIEDSTVDKGATFLTVLDATARYGAGWEFSEQSSYGIEDMLEEFGKKTPSVLLRRKAEAILQTRQGGAARSFGAEKKRVEKQYATADIKIDGIYRERAIVMPVASDYLGIYSADGQARGLLKNKKQPTYAENEIMHPGELPALSIRGQLSFEEKERRLQAQRDFVMLLDKGVLEGIEKDYGISLRELTIREQMWFVAFLRDLKKDDEARVQKFTRTYGINGVRSFLSLEQGREASDAMLIIGERFEKRVANEIFSKYSEIVKASETVRDYLQTQWGKSREYTQEKEDLIVEGLLRRGKDLLARFSEVARTANVANKKLETQSVLEELAHIKADVLLFASAFKEVSKEAVIKFEDLIGIELRACFPRDISARDKQEMRAIFLKNRPGYSAELLTATSKEFQAALAGTDSEFHILKHNREIVAFMRFDELQNGNLYAGSLNVRPEARGSAIGSAMLKALLDKKAAAHTIEAVVYEKNPMLKHYIGDFGFKIVGEIVNYKGTGEKYLKLERAAEQKEEKEEKEEKKLEQAA